MAIITAARVWDNPLFVRERARWRSHWRTPFVVSLLALLATCGYCVLVWVVLFASLYGELPRAMSGPQQVASILLTIAGLGWFVAFVLLPVIAASNVSQERTGGAWDLLRLTGVSSRAIVDGYVVRTLLRVPVWLALTPTLPLQLTAYADAPAVSGLPGRLEAGPAILATLGLLALLHFVGSPVQLLGCVTLGVASGIVARSRSGALTNAFAALFMAEVLLPAFLGFCGVLGAYVIALKLLAGREPPPVLALDTPLAYLAVLVVLAALQLGYHLLVLTAARAYASRQIERASER